MKNLYRTAQNFILRIKKAEEFDFEVDPYYQGSKENAKSKNTPTEHVDSAKQLFNPLLFKFREEIKPFRYQIKILLKSTSIIKSQIDNFLFLLERIDSGLEEVNKTLAVSQVNRNRREEALLYAYDLFLSVFAAGSKAQDGLNLRALQKMAESFEKISTSSETLQKAHKHIQTLQELSRTL